MSMARIRSVTLIRYALCRVTLRRVVLVSTIAQRRRKACCRAPRVAAIRRHAASLPYRSVFFFALRHAPCQLHYVLIARHASARAAFIHARRTLRCARGLVDMMRDIAPMPLRARRCHARSLLSAVFDCRYYADIFTPMPSRHAFI